MFIFVLGKPQYDYGPRKQRMLRTHQDDKKPPRYTQMKPDQDWNSVWPAARTFHPAVVPLPVRQGATQLRNQVENNNNNNVKNNSAGYIGFRRGQRFRSRVSSQFYIFYT